MRSHSEVVNDRIPSSSHCAITAGKSWSGQIATYHPRGYDGVDELNDWLLSPAIDLSGAERIQLTWMEYGAAPIGADHSLWISTGARDPAERDALTRRRGAPSRGWPARPRGGVPR